MSRGLRLRVEQNGYKELTLDNESGSHDVEFMWGLNKWTNVMIWFEINPTCVLKLETSAEHLRTENCNFVASLGIVGGNTLYIGEGANGVYVSNFVVYSSYRGTADYSLRQER